MPCALLKQWGIEMLMNESTKYTLINDLYHKTLDTVESSHLFPGDSIDPDDLADFKDRIAALEDLVTRRMSQDLKAKCEEALSRGKQFLAEMESA